MFQLNCVAGGFVTKLLVSTLLPLGVCALVILVRLVTVCSFAKDPFLESALIQYTLMATYFLIPTTSTIICSAFAVSEFDNGDGTVDRYMTADMSREADGPMYDLIVMYAVAMVLIIPVGFVLMLTVLLWMRRTEIEEREDRKGPKELAYLAFFYRLYSRPMWGLSIVDMSRRLFLTSGLLAFDRSYQLVVALGVSIIFLIMHREVGGMW